MPFINTKVSVELPKDKEASIKEKLGKAIALIPGKSESWLMLNFEDNCRMYFRGNGSQPAAFVEVKVYGGSNAAAFSQLTEAITGILNEELGIAPDHIYVQYQPTEHWGWNGANF